MINALRSRSASLSFSRPQALRRRRTSTSSVVEQLEELKNKIVLETAAELALARFLSPYSLDNLPEVIQNLTGAGYISVESLLGLDYVSIRDLDVDSGDSEKVLLATFLHGVDLNAYGEGLVNSGCDAVLKLLALSDETLVRAGVCKLGHRRQLQRALRQDEQVQERAAKAREEAEAANLKRGLHATGGATRSRRGGRKHAKATSESPTKLPSRSETSIAAQDLGSGKDDPHGLTLVPTTSSGSIHAWSQPWVTTFNAALFGSAPGLRAEAHGQVHPPPRGGLKLVRNDGSVLTVW